MRFLIGPVALSGLLVMVCHPTTALPLMRLSAPVDRPVARDCVFDALRRVPELYGLSAPSETTEVSFGFVLGAAPRRASGLVTQIRDTLLGGAVLEVSLRFALLPNSQLVIEREARAILDSSVSRCRVTRTEPASCRFTGGLYGESGCPSQRATRPPN